MFRLKKKKPPFGTVENPIWEYTYSEQVRVVEGQCEVRLESTRDYLLKMGYEEIKESELVSVGVGTNNPDEQQSISPRSSSSSSKHWKKKKR
jgi:hypothetical protein